MTIFLSASIPLPNRDEKYFRTADVVAIRDAIKAFIQVIAPHQNIHFGGHPAITPLISIVMKRNSNINNQSITLYQSEFFKDKFPQENYDFVKVVYTEMVGHDREASLAKMRERMLTDSPIKAAIFIGGMEGVLDEYKLVRDLNPTAQCFPIASTGGAALEVFRSGHFPPFLLHQLTYRTLFRGILRTFT